MNRWIRSENGRTVLSCMAVFGAAGAGCIQLMPHTFFIAKYREFMQMYKSAIEVKVPSNVIEMADKVLVDCKLTERDVDYIKLFTVFGFDMFSAGSTKLVNGANIGIPYNFRYNDISDVDVSLLKVDTDPDAGDLDYESSTGKRLLSSIVLSERAKRFAIAREVYSCTTYRYLAGCVGTSVTLLSGYIMGSTMNQRFNLQRLPVALRVAAYSVCGSIGLLCCYMINDTISIYYDGNADKMAANLGDEYALGGVEFYEKQMVKNKCLRRLMGQKGEKFYTASGNLHMLIRTKSLPLSARLDYLKEKVEDYNEAKK